MPETPRIWTGVLMREDGRLETHGVTVPTPRNFGVITVYEAASVDVERERLLDLIERVEDWLQVPDYTRYSDLVSAQQVEADVKTALREYGRLGKKGS